MENKNIFGFNVNWNYRSALMLLFLAILPNLLGMVNIQTAFGLKIHLFQYLIFIAAAVYGPMGGLISGAAGSAFTAVTMHNPYIIIGNMILGFMTGLLFRKGFKMIYAVMIAFMIQVPWLWLTDVYLAGMNMTMVNMIVAALLLSNIVWAVAASLSYKSIRKAIQ